MIISPLRQIIDVLLCFSDTQLVEIKHLHNVETIREMVTSLYLPTSELRSAPACSKHAWICLLCLQQTLPMYSFQGKSNGKRHANLSCATTQIRTLPSRQQRIHSLYETSAQLSAISLRHCLIGSAGSFPIVDVSGR